MNIADKTWIAAWKDYDARAYAVARSLHCNPATVYKAWRRLKLRTRISRHTKREVMELAQLILGANGNMAQVGRELGVTRERVRQMWEKASAEAGLGS